MPNSVDPRERLMMSRLIRIYNVCKIIALVCRAEMVDGRDSDLKLHLITMQFKQL